MRGVEFTAEAYLDLKRLRAHERATILDAIERHLAAPRPRSGKKIKQLRLADGEFIYRLRVGEYRVFFDIVDVGSVVISNRHKGRRATEETL